jgi:hypothetical protein
MKKIHLTTAVFSLLLLASCASPVSHSNIPLSTYDRDTEYAIAETDLGFTLTVYYSRYQFIPESAALAAACKSALTSIAWEISERRGRKISPVNDQKIRMSMGRNGFSGTTSCQAYVAVDWLK